MGDRDRMTLPEEGREEPSTGDDDRSETGGQPESATETGGQPESATETGGQPTELADLPEDRREELLASAIARLAEERGIDVPDAETLERVRAELDRTRSTVDRLETDVETLRGDLDEQIADVRERVISVLEEAESRAPKDHTHPAIDDRIDALRSTVTDLSSRSESLEREIDSVTDLRADAADRDDRLADHDEKLTRLAGAFVNVQRRLDRLERERARREALTDLLAAANRRDVTEARCESCEATVRIGLLGRPRCPHCEGHFEDVEPKSGFFGSAWLRVGDPPALEGETTEPRDPADLFEGDEG
jgi:predicted  nucleic acid-binding Zn-ribbon protein